MPHSDTPSSAPRHGYDERSAASLVEKMLRAIRYCHLNGVVHRDIKLDNFIYEAPGEDAELKLIDFGFACEVRGWLTWARQAALRAHGKRERGPGRALFWFSRHRRGREGGMAGRCRAALGAQNGPQEGGRAPTLTLPLFLSPPPPQVSPGSEDMFERLGTLSYMAPELLGSDRRTAYNSSIDMWSLGRNPHTSDPPDAPRFP